MVYRPWTMKPVKSTKVSWKKFGRWNTNLYLPIFISGMQLNAPFSRSKLVYWQSFLALSRTFRKKLGSFTSVDWDESQSSEIFNIENRYFCMGIFNGPSNYNHTPLGTLGCKAIIHKKTGPHHSWDFIGKDGWNIVASLEQYCFQLVVTWYTKAVQVSNNVDFLITISLNRLSPTKI